MGQNLEDTRHKLPRVISLLSYQDVPISPLSKSGTTCEMLSSRTRVSLDSVPNAFMAHKSHRQAPPSTYQIPRRKASFQHESPCTNTLGPGSHTQLGNGGNPGFQTPAKGQPVKQDFRRIAVRPAVCNLPAQQLQP